jgi:heme/copper-type cytochrome/quinol oxidase subunit 2
MSWILPPSASTFAGDIDFLFYVILVLTGIAFVVVEVGLVVFAIKYRARPGRKAQYIIVAVLTEYVW